MDATTIKQVHGDFGNPWLYGGAWSDGAETVYTRGREGEGREWKLGPECEDPDDDPTATVEVYRWNDAWTERDREDWESSIGDACKSCGMEREDFDKLPTAGKWLVLAEYMGPIELDCYPVNMTRDALAKLIHDSDI